MKSTPQNHSEHIEEFRYKFSAVVVDPDRTWVNLWNALEEQTGVFNALLDLPDTRVMDAAAVHVERCKSAVTVAQQSIKAADATKSRLKQLQALSQIPGNAYLKTIAQTQMEKLSVIVDSFNAKKKAAQDNLRLAKRLYRDAVRAAAAQPNRRPSRIADHIDVAKRHINSVGTKRHLWWKHNSSVLNDFTDYCHACIRDNTKLEKRIPSLTGNFHFEFTERARSSEDITPIRVLSSEELDHQANKSRDFLSVFLKVYTHDPHVEESFALFFVSVPKLFFPPLDLGLRTLSFFVPEQRESKTVLDIYLTFASNAVNSPFWASDIVSLLPINYSAARDWHSEPSDCVDEEYAQVLGYYRRPRQVAALLGGKAREHRNGC